MFTPHSLQMGLHLQVAFHGHPLVLSDERTEEEVFRCRICSERVRGLAYSCTECLFTLHKWCLERPLELHVPAHPQHTLTLSFDQTNSYTAKCNICNSSIYDYYPCAAYVCMECQLYCHITCASLSGLNVIIFKGSQYSTEVHRLGRNTCDACGVDMFRDYLRSVNGEKFLHVRCAFLPISLKHQAHRHALALTRAYEMEGFDPNDLHCEICRDKVEKGGSVYSCGDCKVNAHISCANTVEHPPTDMLRTIPVYSDELKKYHENNFIDDLNRKLYILRKNANEDLGNQASRDLEMEKTREKAREREKAKEQLHVLDDHFLHQDHPLLLFSEPINYAVLCNVCCCPIFGKMYICQKCKFYLHLSCARLPHEMLHSEHQDHPLKQTTQSCHHFICKICGSPSFGLSYCCQTCDDFEVDFQCAFVNREVVNGIHKHPLKLRRQNRHHVENVCEYLNQNLSAQDLYNRGPFFRIPPPCTACGDPCEGARYECRKCKFYVHTSCSILKKEGSSRHHRHPLELDYRPTVDEESEEQEEDTTQEDDEEYSEEEESNLEKEDEEEYCDDCEKERNPRHWVYSCKEYNCFVAHVTCANPMMETIPFKTNSKG